MNEEIRTVAARFFSGNICFDFSVLVFAVCISPSRISCSRQGGPQGSKDSLWPGCQANTADLRFFSLKPPEDTGRRLYWNPGVNIVSSDRKWGLNRLTSCYKISWYLPFITNSVILVGNGTHERNRSWCRRTGPAINILMNTTAKLVTFTLSGSPPIVPNQTWGWLAWTRESAWSP